MSRFTRPELLNQLTSANEEIARGLARTSLDDRPAFSQLAEALREMAYAAEALANDYTGPVTEPHVVDLKHGLDTKRSPFFLPDAMVMYSRDRECLARIRGEFEQAVLWQQLADHCEELQQ